MPSILFQVERVKAIHMPEAAIDIIFIIFHKVNVHPRKQQAMKLAKESSAPIFRHSTADGRLNRCSR